MPSKSRVREKARYVYYARPLTRLRSPSTRCLPAFFSLPPVASCTFFVCVLRLRPYIDLHRLHRTMIRDPSPAFFIFAALIGLLGLAHVLRPWSRRQTKRPISFLVIYFVAILVLFSLWLRFEWNWPFFALFQLSWLGGLSIEAVLLEITFSTSSISRISRTLRIFRILVPIITTTVGLLQVMGFGLRFYNKDIGVYVTFTGGCVFRVFAAVAFTFLLTHKMARHRKPIFIALTNTSALSGCGFIRIANRDKFFLANCMLECFVLLSLLVLAVVFQDEDNLDANEISQWQILITQINVDYTMGQPRTPPPVLAGKVHKIIRLTYRENFIWVTTTVFAYSIHTEPFSQRYFWEEEIELKSFVHCPGAQLAFESLQTSDQIKISSQVKSARTAKLDDDTTLFHIELF